MVYDEPAMPPGDQLFHYTTGRGLLGIVGSGEVELHATSTLYMNDSREAMEASLHLHRAARHWRGHFEPWKQNLIDDEFPDNPPVDELLLPQAVREVFTVSFTEAGDLLSQWRAYTEPGDGYALSFSATAIQQKFQDDAASTGKYDDAYYLVKCLYVDPRKDLTPADPVSRAIFLWLGHPGGTPSFKGLHHDREVLSSRVKHIAFEEEQEWRLPSHYTKHIPDNLCFKPGSFSIKPFTTFTFPKSTLQGVCVGPGPYQALAKRAVEQLLRQRDYAHVEVTCSTAPLRRS